MRRTLSLRWWLALAVLLAAVLSLLVAIGVGLVTSSSAPANPVMQLPARIIKEHQSWEDPAWQRQLAQELGALHADVLLADDQGRTVFQSHTDPLAGPPSSAWRYTQADLTVSVGARTVDLYDVHHGDALVGLVRLYRPVTPRPPLRNFGPLGMALAVVGLGTAGAVAVMLRIFVPPLRALAAAADLVREGDLDFTLKPSPVREVDAVVGAFTQMAQGLRQLTYRQAAMDEERRFFLAAISHDLRTPLFSLRGRLEGIRDGIAATQEQARRYAVQALHTLAALDRLVADLFTHTRLNLLDQAPRREPIDWRELLWLTAESLQPAAGAKGVRLLLPEQTCQGTGDAHLLGRAVGNLLDNAIRHTPPGGTVSVTLAAAGAQICVSVEDSGPGIDPELLPRLFAPLVQGEPSRSRATSGAGLGLVIARAVVEAHGGTIAAANVPGGGARFRITLPAGSR